MVAKGSRAGIANFYGRNSIRKLTSSTITAIPIPTTDVSPLVLREH